MSKKAATTSKSRTARKTSKPRAKSTRGPQRAKPNPNPGPMPTNESVNPGAKNGIVKFKHRFQPGEEVGLWPASLITKPQLKGEQPLPTPHGQATILEDGTLNLAGIGRGKWVVGGPAGYPVEDRYHEVTVK